MSERIEEGDGLAMPAVVEFALERAFDWLAPQDLARCCAAARAMEPWRAELGARAVGSLLPALRLGTRRHIAAARVLRWWRQRALLAWLRVVYGCVTTMHAFPHRTETSFQAWKPFFRGGIAAIQRLRRARPDRRVRHETLRCPQCSAGGLETAYYFVVGSKMARSMPFAHVTCRRCADHASREWLRMGRGGMDLMTFLRTNATPGRFVQDSAWLTWHTAHDGLSDEED